MPQLNERQRKFAEEYIKDGNATKAALSAGYSEKTAPQIGYGLLKLPHVAAEIARLTGRNEKKSALTAEKVMAKLNNLVDFDPAQCVDADGKLLPINKMPLEARQALSAIDMDKGTFKRTSYLGSLELAAKILQLVKQEQTQQQAVQIIIAAPAAQPDVSAVERPRITPVWE